MASAATPRFTNTTKTSLIQESSPYSKAPPMKKQRATASPNAAGVQSAEYPAAAAVISSSNGTNTGFPTASGSRTNSSSVLRPPTTHSYSIPSVTMSNQVIEAVKTRREELRKLQEQNKYTRSVVFPPANRKQQILSLAKAQLTATSTGSSLVATNSKNESIGTTAIASKSNTTLLSTKKENAASTTATARNLKEEEIDTPARPRRLDLVNQGSNNTIRATPHVSSASAAMPDYDSGNTNSRAQVFHTMLENATVSYEEAVCNNNNDSEDKNDHNETISATLRLLSEFKKSKLQNEEELIELKETIQQITHITHINSNDRSLQQESITCLFDDDATVTSVRTTNNNSRRKVGLGLGSLMSPIRPSMRTTNNRQHEKKTSTKAPRPATKQQLEQQIHISKRTTDNHANHDNAIIVVDDLKKFVEQALRVAVQKFTSAVGNEYVVAFVSPLAKDADSLEYYYANVANMDSGMILSKLTRDEHHALISSLVVSFHNNDDATALATIACYIRVYAFIQADQSVLLVKHISPDQLQIIHWNRHTKNVLRKYKLTSKDTQSNQTLQNALGNVSYIDSFGTECRYKLSDVYREAMVVQHDFLTSIASTTWAFQQTNNYATSPLIDSNTTIQSAITRTAEDSMKLFDDNNNNLSSSLTLGSLVSPIRPVSHHPMDINTTNETKVDSTTNTTTTADARGFQSTSHTNNVNILNDNNNNVFVPAANSSATTKDSVDVEVLLPRYVEQAFLVAVQKFTSSQGNEYEIVFVSPNEEDGSRIPQQQQQQQTQQPLSRLSNTEKEEVVSSLVQNMTSSSSSTATNECNALTKLACYIRVYAQIKADQSKLLVKHSPINSVQILHFEDSTTNRCHNLWKQDLSSDFDLSEKLGRIIYIDSFGMEQEYNLSDVYREAILAQQHFLMGITSSAWAFYRKDILLLDRQNNKVYNIMTTLSNGDLQQQQPHPPNEYTLVSTQQQNVVNGDLLQATTPPFHTARTSPARSDEKEVPLVKDEPKTIAIQKKEAEVEKQEPKTIAFQKNEAEVEKQGPKMITVQKKESTVEKQATTTTTVSKTAATGMDNHKVIDEEEPIDTTTALMMLLGFVFSSLFHIVVCILIRIPIKMFKLTARFLFWTVISSMIWLLLVDDFGLRLNQHGGTAGRAVATRWPTVPILQKILNVLFGIGHGGDIDHYHNGVY